MFCIDCFVQIGIVDKCPFCGFAQAERLRDRRALAVGVFVNKRYKIGRVLGSGGFGITYLAKDTSLNRRVALKEFVPNGLASRAQDGMQLECHSYENEAPFNRGLDRFLKEGKFLAQFDNPNVIKPFDVFLENGTAYLAMEYFEGWTLKTLLQKRGVYSEFDALDAIQFVTDALRAVHAQNIIHRDVKPDNIYQTTQGRIILLDFGGAKELTVEGDRSVDAMFAHGYAAPEQYMGNTQKIGPWTDVYACGATLFKLITSRKPPNALERMTEHHLLDWKDTNVSERTKHAITLAMAIKCEERIQSISDLQALLGFGPVITPPNTPPIPSVLLPEPPPAPPDSIQPRNPADIAPAPPPPAQSTTATASSWSPKSRVFFSALGTVLIGILGYKFWPQPTQESIIVPPVPVIKDDPTVGACERSLKKTEFSRPKMIMIPAGSYRLGSGQSNDTFPSEKNTLGGSLAALAKFEIAETETTIGQWLACASENACSKEIVDNNDKLLSLTSDTEKLLPVTNVSFKDMEEYTHWLSRKTKMRFSLPTEAEWEFASRGGTDTVFPWSNDTEAGKAHCVACRSPFGTTAPVASKQFFKNNFGLYDMQGNVFELVSDCWTANHNSVSSSPRETCPHVQKGGAFDSPWREVLPIYREAIDHDERKKNLGFRVICHMATGQS